MRSKQTWLIWLFVFNLFCMSLQSFAIDVGKEDIWTKAEVIHGMAQLVVHYRAMSKVSSADEIPTRLHFGHLHITLPLFAYRHDPCDHEFGTWDSLCQAFTDSDHRPLNLGQAIIYALKNSDHVKAYLQDNAAAFDAAYYYHAKARNKIQQAHANDANINILKMFMNSVVRGEKPSSSGWTYAMEAQNIDLAAISVKTEALFAKSKAVEAVKDTEVAELTKDDEEAGNLPELRQYPITAMTTAAQINAEHNEKEFDPYRNASAQFKMNCLWLGSGFCMQRSRHMSDLLEEMQVPSMLMVIDFYSTLMAWEQGISINYQASPEERMFNLGDYHVSPVALDTRTGLFVVVAPYNQLTPVPLSTYLSRFMHKSKLRIHISSIEPGLIKQAKSILEQLVDFTLETKPGNI